MYLHVGNEIAVRTEDIIGIFDMDNTTVSVRGREFLPMAQKNGSLVTATEDLPKSYVVAGKRNGARVYVSSYTTQALAKHSRTLF